MSRCKNCDRELTGPFCAGCGQPARTERITFAYLWHEAFHFFTHLERGFLRTTWQLLRRPGSTVHSFIDGKRIRYQRPVSYFLIWTAAYLLVLYLVERTFGENVVIAYGQYFGVTTRVAIGHLSIVLATLIPFQALYLYLLIGRRSYNYVECAVAVIYALGTLIALQLGFAVLAVLAHLVAGATLDLGLSDIFKVLYIAWFTFDFITPLPIRWKVVRGVAYLVLAFGTFTLWRLYGFPALAGWLMPT